MASPLARGLFAKGIAESAYMISTPALKTAVHGAPSAEQAGLKGGDIITAIGAKTVANLYDMTDALRSHQAGDTVVIVLRRADAEVHVTAVLGKRT